MNARDFCFWLQGYMELTGDKPVPKNAWKLILEHLELAKLHAGESREEFEGIVNLLSGFISVAGTGVPSEEQWARMTALVQDLFVKVTSDLDSEDDEPDTDTIMKEILEKIKEKDWEPTMPYTPPQIPPYMPYPESPLTSPWKRDPHIDPWAPSIICKADSKTDSSQVFCSSANEMQNVLSDHLDKACETIESLHVPPSSKAFGPIGTCGPLDDAYDSHLPMADLDCGMYDLGVKLGAASD